MIPTQHPTANHRDELLEAAVRLLERQLPLTPVTYIWPDAHCVLFRFGDGRTGSVELQVNWDVVRTESTAHRSTAP